MQECLSNALLSAFSRHSVNMFTYITKYSCIVHTLFWLELANLFLKTQQSVRWLILSSNILFFEPFAIVKVNSLNQTSYSYSFTVFYVLVELLGRVFLFTCQWYTNLVKLLRIIFSMEYSPLIMCLCSPIGEVFRARLRQFPALVNCCTIDWFSPWPQEALQSVAWRFLGDLIDLDERSNIDGIVSFTSFLILVFLLFTRLYMLLVYICWLYYACY